MTNLVDYKFYKEKYRGQMKEDCFEKNILLASQYLRYVTAGRADTYEGMELKYAACEVADIYQDMQSGQRKQSENNDGYSVTFVTEGETGETAEQLRDRKAYQATRKWLLFTGLLSRKVVSGHADQCGYYTI